MLKTDYLNLLYKRDTRIEPTLEGISRLLVLLGMPQNNFDILQVGGTNGKSSTVHLMSLLLQSQGLKVGRYTSPHLESFGERIAVNNQNTTEEKIVIIIESIYSEILEVEKSIRRELTGFEILTACAFVHFSREKVDVATIEVGMGGRWDATSVALPKVCAITNVELDHMAYLGNTKIEIASEKIGIVKNGCPIVTTEQDKDILTLFAEHCKDLNSKLFRWPDDFRSNFDAIDERNLRVEGIYGEYEFPVTLKGNHQLLNVALAVATVELYLGGPIEVSNAAKTLNSIWLGGRLEVVSENPLVMLDGAHNPAAVKVLTEEIRKINAGKKVVVLAILSDKDVASMLQMLGSVFDTAVITQNESERSIAALDLFELSRSYFKDQRLNESIEGAVLQAKCLAGSDGLVCVTGSLYTVGAAKQLFS